MDSNFRFQLYRELYFREMERRTQIRQGITFPATVVTALLTAAFYLLSRGPQSLDRFHDSFTHFRWCFHS